jgi:hypothetical protein
LMVTDEWLDTSGAHLLQSVLWSGHPDSRQYALRHPGQAWSAVPFPLEEGTHPLMPPEHLLTFETDDRGVDWLSIIVFAELLYSVPLDIDQGPMSAWSWWFSPSVKVGRQLPASVQAHVLNYGWPGEAG